jgi:hypothetical protein
MTLELDDIVVLRSLVKLKHVKGLAAVNGQRGMSTWREVMTNDLRLLSRGLESSTVVSG